MKIAKKIVSMCLALAMIVTTFAVNTVDVKAEEATGCTITLTDDYSNSEGKIRSSMSVQKAGSYKYILCYDGQEGPYRLGGQNVSYDLENPSVSNGTMFIGGDYFEELSHGGSAQIMAKLYKGDEVVATSNTITITLANERLEAPNAVVNGNTITWDAVEGAAKYNVWLLKDNTTTVLQTDVEGCSYDFSNYPDTTRVLVKAYSSDYSQKLDSKSKDASFDASNPTEPSDPTEPSNPTPPSTDDSNSSNDSGSSSESGSVAPTYAPTDADIYEQQMKEKEAKYKKAVTGADGKEVTSSINGVYEVNTMAGTAVKSAKADVAKAVLTEDEIQNGTNTSIYMSDGLSKEVKDSLKNVASANGKTVLTMFMADMYKISKAGEVIKTNNLKENIEMVFGIPSYAVDANRTYSVLCVTPDGRTIEFKDMDNDPSTITLNANVLGNYAVVF